MEFTFNCPECNQELAVDDNAIGAEINCPTCSKTITIPKPSNGAALVPPSSFNAEAKESRHFVVPQRAGKESALIEKPLPTLEVAAKDTDKKVKVKTIRHGDCVEVGKDRFDEMVTQFLHKIGESNLIAMHPVQYSHGDAAGHNMVNDYGLLIIFKG
jgi:ribosomal protein S27E